MSVSPVGDLSGITLEFELKYSNAYLVGFQTLSTVFWPGTSRLKWSCSERPDEDRGGACQGLAMR